PLQASAHREIVGKPFQKLRFGGWVKTKQRVGWSGVQLGQQICRGILAFEVYWPAGGSSPRLFHNYVLHLVDPQSAFRQLIGSLSPFVGTLELYKVTRNMFSIDLNFRIGEASC